MKISKQFEKIGFVEILLFLKEYLQGCVRCRQGV